MCQICSFRRCPPACPSYRGISRERGRPTGQCDECGEFVYSDDIFYEAGKTVLCAVCGADGNDIEVK